MRNLVALGAALGLLAAAPAWATLGPHAQSVDGNHCKICHDTASGTPTLRGWNGGVPGGGGLDPEWGTRNLSLLCYMCHLAGGGGVGANDMSNNAYAGTSHGNDSPNIPEAPDESAQVGLEGSGLPYTRDLAIFTNLECTSCHNVHRVESRVVGTSSAPFMQRDSVAVLCEICHTGRNNDAPNRRFGNTMPSLGVRTYSTHPVGMGVNNTGNTGISIKDIAAAPTNVNVALPAAPGYALGGHLEDGTVSGTLHCGTCHAVHGPTQGSPGINDLLAVENTTAVWGAGVYNLCETCHNGGWAGGNVGTDPTNATDHPIDQDGGRVFYPTLVTIPADWTQGGGRLDRGAQPFYNGVTPVCSSCHDAHGGLDNTPLLRFPDSTGGNVFAYDDWCWRCHLADGISPDNHHSNTGNWATSQLDCNDCHGTAAGAEWTAHNGFWDFPVAVTATDSALCEGCHVAENPRTFISPNFKGRVGLTAAAGDFPASHGTLRDGVDDPTATGSSHQVNMAPNATNPNLVPNMALVVWSSGGTSEVGAGNTPICESCHNILVNGDPLAQGLTEGWQANLLLQPYEDDLPGTAAGEGANDFYGDTALGAGPTGDGLCRGCHNGQGTNPADFVHNPGAHTQVSASFTYPVAEVPYGRSTLTVLTGGACIEATTADAATAPGTASYPAADALNCDSCHRPHNADNDSLDTNRYLILEISAPLQQGSTICAECHDTDIQCQ